jgi:putative ABC transport system substrate-binding protein
MRRREFIAALGAAASPLAGGALAQAPPIIAFLNGQSASEWAPYTEAFLQGLREKGFVDGQNVKIEYHWGAPRDQLPSMAIHLVRRRPTVLVISGSGTAPVLAVKEENLVTPVVFLVGDDPVRAGIVPGLHKPGGNLTGISIFAMELGSKRVQLLHELLPKASAFAMLVNPHNKGFQVELADVREAMRALGLRLEIVEASSDADFDRAFQEMIERRVEGAIIGADPFFNSRRAQLTTVAARYAIPAIWEWREFADVGGLISYGTMLRDMYRQVGDYTGRILRGERPGDLPVAQPTRFELVINLKTAKTLGLTIPPTLLARADEVIE